MSTAADLPFLTVSEAARLTRLSTKSVYRLIDSGQIPAIKVSGSIRIPVAWRDALMRAAGEAVAASLEAGSHRAAEGSAGA
ncbi:MAG: helix-turn-helix domain-containing protein [Phycisphaeraceae bacterium]|nr:helix-turn-helix domain-containing protein [Phycisphaeraceae bacterium]